MSAKAELLRAVAELERVLQSSAELPNNDRQQMVQSRRSIAEQLAIISTIGQRAMDNSEINQGFRSQFSRMRSAMALHQASWPIVAIRFDDPAYAASLRETRDANRQFIDWVRIDITPYPH